MLLCICYGPNMLFYILVGITFLFHNESFAEAQDNKECGILNSGSGQVPWHAVVYKKKELSNVAVCGGTLISNYKIITVAQCFWSPVERSALPASMFAVAVGKQTQPWDVDDGNAQKSDVKSIRIPARYFGQERYFQDDIAVVIVTSPFEINQFVLPVCLDFDISFEDSQLQDGAKGIISGHKVDSTGEPSPILQVTDISYIDVSTCIRVQKPPTLPYITSDKICAGHFKPGTGVCKGDSGTGLAFPITERGVSRYYLRGAVAITDVHHTLCTTENIILFTQISFHEHFLNAKLGTQLK